MDISNYLHIIILDTVNVAALAIKSFLADDNSILPCFRTP